MRGFIVLLFGSISLLLASALSSPAYAQQRKPEPVAFHLQMRHVHVDVDNTPIGAEQVEFAQLAAVLPDERSKPHPDRFYTRWRRVHGRWYQFTFRKGERKASLKRLKIGAELG